MLLNFVIREMGEIYAIKTLMGVFNENGVSININLVVLPFNSDFSFISIENEFMGIENIRIIPPIGLTEGMLWDMDLFGFSGNIQDGFTKFIKKSIDIYEVCSCRQYDLNAGGVRNTTKGIPRIVISNLKVNDKDVEEEYNNELLGLLSDFPYRFTIVPRHPIVSKEKLDSFLRKIPKNMELHNSMGKLEGLCSNADLTIMGKIFSNTIDDRDHNPFEATINSNTVAGKFSFIPEPFVEFYNSSGLVYRYRKFIECLSDLDSLISDPFLSKKLTWKEKWIQQNRTKYFQKWFNLITNS